VYNVPYCNFIYNLLPKDEPSGSKHVEEIKIENQKVNLEKAHFVVSCCVTLLQITVQKTKKKLCISIFAMDFALVLFSFHILRTQT